MGGKASREKGKRGEREWRDVLKEHGYEDAYRGVQYSGGPDSPDVVGIPGIHFEVKRVEKLNIYNAMKQSIDDAGEKEIPVVAHRRDREQWLVTMNAEDFLYYVLGYQAACHEGCSLSPGVYKEWAGR